MPRRPSPDCVRWAWPWRCSPTPLPARGADAPRRWPPDHCRRRRDPPALTASYIGEHYPEARCLLLNSGDIDADVLGAQHLGITGVLVKTGKFLPEALEAADGIPDHVVDSIADVPDLLVQSDSRPSIRRWIPRGRGCRRVFPPGATWAAER